ncbi:MAG: HEAT repeat domain-containing protein [Planctomycetes bacterium]|nr:HEAT repeat domain-containing protein [Planctomycetota bacterium]MBI3845077.1 HEAT repeat domain-containing protein [Planctomycetota bacterium]
MKCEAARFILDQYLENQLNPVQRERLEEHLATCATCTREVAHHRGFRKLLEKYFAEVRMPDGFAEELMLKLDKPATAIRKRPPTEVGPVLVEPPRRSSRVVPGIAAVVLVVVVAVTIVRFWPKSNVEAAASVAAVQGSASVRLPDDGDWKPATPLQPLIPKTAVRTGKGGSAKIATSDKSTIELAEESEIEISAISAAAGTTIRLASGGAVFNVLNGEERFRVETTCGEVTVRRAERYVTEFEAILPRPVTAGTSPASAVGRVTVHTGEVSVEGSGAVVTIGAGMQSLLRAGQPPTNPSSTEPAKPGTVASKANVDKKPPGSGSGNTPRKPGDKPASSPSTGLPNPQPTKPAETLDALISRVQDGSTEEATRVGLVARIPQLAKEDERDVARGAIRELLRRNTSEKIRAAAVKALGALKEEDLFPEIADAFRSDPSVEVKRAAITAMVELKKEDARGQLVEALGQGSALAEELRLDVVRALGAIKNAADVPALVGVLRADESLHVREEVATILGTIHDKEVVGPLIEILRDSNPSLRAKAAQSLRLVSGQAIDFNPEGTDEEREAAVQKWEEWWAQNRDTFQ